MIQLVDRWGRTGALALGLALAACGGGGSGPPRSAGTTAPAPAGEVDAILALLDGGDAKTARKRIAAGLERDPMDPSLLVLRDSLDRDPIELLGPANHAYTVRPGDTMTGLAERFLGNKLKAYQLARYNGVARPADLSPGQLLRIPGAGPAPAQAREDEPRRDPRRRADAPARPALAAPRPKPATGKPLAAARPADPGAARAARAAGLAALNQGQVVRAVGLLRRASQLDPGDALARRDLQRAERIASAVRARR